MSKILNFVGIVASVGLPIGKRVLDFIGLAGIPDDAAVWWKLMGSFGWLEGLSLAIFAVVVGNILRNKRIAARNDIYVASGGVELFPKIEFDENDDGCRIEKPRLGINTYRLRIQGRGLKNCSCELVTIERMNNGNWTRLNNQNRITLRRDDISPNKYGGWDLDNAGYCTVFETDRDDRCYLVTNSNYPTFTSNLASGLPSHNLENCLIMAVGRYRCRVELSASGQAKAAINIEMTVTPSPDQATIRVL